MADFLLDLGYGSKRLFLKSGDGTSECQISDMYVKFKGGGVLKPFCHTQTQDLYQISSYATSDACAKFREFTSTPSTSKMLKVIRGRYRPDMPHPCPIAILNQTIC